jgi:DNA-binding CsgD family transcriptional regulator
MDPRVALRSLLEHEFDLSRQSIETFLEKIRAAYLLQGLIFFSPSQPERRALKGTQRPWPGPHDKEKNSWLASLRRMTRVAWSQTQRRSIPLPFILVGAGGSRQFLSIPVHSTNGVWAFLIATSNETDIEWAGRQDQLAKDLRHIAHHMHRRIAGLLNNEDEIDFSEITKREAEALSLASVGKSGEEIAIAMGISPQTAREHLDYARRKLKALNRTHAVSKALKAGLI